MLFIVVLTAWLSFFAFALSLGRVLPAPFSSHAVMSPKKEKHMLRKWAAVAVVGLVLVGLAGEIFPSLFEITAQCTEKVTPRGYVYVEGPLEKLEAVLWLGACLFYAASLRRTLRATGWAARPFWLCVFLLLSLAALGEEESWGQHLFQFTSSAAVAGINAQGELNLHNLNVAKLINIAPGSALGRKLKNLTALINPLALSTCGTLWCIFPLLKLRKRGIRSRLLSSFPSPTRATAALFGAILLGLEVIDRAWFDVGEIIEFTLALCAFSVAFELYKEHRGLAKVITACAEDSGAGYPVASPWAVPILHTRDLLARFPGKRCSSLQKYQE